MQRLPRLTRAALLVAIAFSAIQLRNIARGWQDPKPATTADPAAPAKADTPAPEPNPEATGLVKSARDRLSKWQSIQANVIQRVDIGDRRFKASGRFVAGEFPKLRLEYEVNVGNTVGRLLEVCDGQVLHVERRIEDASAAENQKADVAELKDTSKPAIESTRRDVQRILRATAEAEGAAVSMHAADIGLGGLSALLASLDRTMVFDSIRDEEHDGQKFRVVQGVWNPKYLSDLQTRLGAASQQLAGFLPERVRIYFEAETQFPVRILYLKLASTGDRRAYKPILSLEFHDVEFDAAIPPETFSYRVPTGIPQKDDTDEYVQMLKVSQGQAQPPPSEPAAEPLKLKRTVEPTKR